MSRGRAVMLCLMQVLAYDAEKTWYSASGTVSATTYQSPHDVQLLDATSSSIFIAWVSPTDDSIRHHTFQYTKVRVCRSLLFDHGLGHRRNNRRDRGDWFPSF